MIARISWTVSLTILIVQLHSALRVECENMRNGSVVDREMKTLVEKDYKIICYQVVNNNISFAINFQYEINMPTPDHSMFAHRVVALKKKNKDLKVLLSLGGWAYEPQQYKQMVADKRERELFINNTLETLAKFKMDGLDMYPDNLANRGDVIYRESLAYLVPLLQDLREAFRPFNYTLTAALPGDLSVVPGSAQVMAKMAESLDFITIIAYDLHGAWENVTVHASPLYTSFEAKDQNKSISVGFTGGTFVIKGRRGQAMAGNWDLKRQTDSWPAKFWKVVCPQKWQRQVSDDQLFDFVPCAKRKIFCSQWPFLYKWLDVEKAPFVYVTEPDSHIAKWAGVEDIWSIDYKVKYLMDAELGGATLFSLDKDDHRGVCLQKPFPILRAINHHLNRKQKVAFPELGYKLTYTEAALLNAPDKTAYIAYLFGKLYSSGNRSKEVELFCECKKGLHSIKLIEKTNATAYLVANCDTLEITIAKPGQIDESTLSENQFTLDYFSDIQKQKRLEGNGSLFSLQIVRLGSNFGKTIAHYGER